MANHKQRLLIHIASQRQWLIPDISRDFHTEFGVIDKRVLKSKHASTIKSNREDAFLILDASFMDVFLKSKRHAQVILPHDAAMVLAYTGAGAETVVVDAGAGSGWLCCFLARYVKKVYCYDIVEKHLETAKQNAERLGVSNISFFCHDIYDGMKHKANLLTLDVPEPWQVLAHAKKKLAIGGYVVCYSPSLTQSQQTVVVAEQEGFIVMDTTEIIRRQWDIDTRRVRPRRDAVGPTGFLTFLRYLGA
jgi:tRNA (adenine57-N1/adenine58-N1)-methyltransferase